jgi:hypothetical protein
MKTKLALLTVAFLAFLVAPATGSGGPIILGGAFGGEGIVGTDPKTGETINYTAFGVDTSVIARISTTDGSVESFSYYVGDWALPAVTFFGQPGGLSADGRTLVITDQYPQRGQGSATHFRFLNAHNLNTRDKLKLPGTWSFDAMSPEGGLVYLVHYRDPRNPLDYAIRQYDVPGGVLRGGALVDLDEPDEKMTGQPLSRVTSPDGADVFTLYGGGEEVFIHALHTEIGQADCIDIDQVGRKVNIYELRLIADPQTGVITVLDGKRPVAVVDPETLVAHDSPMPDLAAAVGDAFSA